MDRSLGSSRGGRSAWFTLEALFTENSSENRAHASETGGGGGIGTVILWRPMKEVVRSPGEGLDTRYTSYRGAMI